jgi:hypothetical protein
MEVDAVDAAHFAEQVDDLRGAELRPGRGPEGIAPDVADGPEAEGELVLGSRCELIGHAMRSAAGQGTRVAPNRDLAVHWPQ